MLQWLRTLQEAVMPLRCAFCGTLTTEREGPVCPGCCEDLPRADPVPADDCLECEIAPLAYEFPVDAAIKALKFRRRLYYGAAFGHLLCAACEDLPGDIDALLPVPLHWWRQWFRGFNQAREIARPVAQHLGVPLISAVVRRRATPSQAGLNAAERAKNLQNAFVTRGRPKFRHVLVVDDVITTGATVRQVARSLHRSGVEKVSALALARA